MKKLTILLLFPLFISAQSPNNYVHVGYPFNHENPIYEIRLQESGTVFDKGIKLGTTDTGGKLYYYANGIWTEISAASTDSLWTETPAIKDAATAAVTVGEEFTTPAGRLKAIKFWKNETAGNYVITLWHPNGASLFSQQYKSTTTGWQKITMDLPLESGTYVIGVYFPNGKYVYTNGLNPRTRTNLTGNKGLFSGGNSKPGGSYTASFFVDVVIEYTPTVPLSVKTSPDREATMPKDSVGVSATATGYTKFQWTVEDFEGRFTLKDTNTLKPYVIPLDSSGCRVWLFCTVTDAGGNQLADAVAIRVAPHPKMVMGYYLWNGTFVWRVPPTFIELPTPATYVRP